MSDYVTKTNVLSALARFKENTDALYETKADANDMKSEIDQHDARLQNLEQKAGDYSIVQYRGTNAVPTGKAKYGLVKNIVGKTRAWNQLYDISNQLEIDSSGITLTVGTTYLTINGTASASIYRQTPSTFKFVSGHKYLFIMSGWSETKCYLTDQSGLNIFGSGTRVHNNIILTAVASGGDLRITIPSGSAFTNVKMTLNCYDLTLIFGAGNEPTTVADALAQLPALGEYNAYDAGSLVDTVVSGVKSVGVNIWDEEWEVGRYDSSTGQKSDSTTNIRNKNFIKVCPNTSYYYKASAVLAVFYYDANMNFISLAYAQNEVKTTPSNACYINFFLASGYGTTYNHDIQICLNSYADKTTYHPYKTDTLFLPETVTLRSAGSVADTDELNVEVEVGGVMVSKRRQTTRVGRHTFIQSDNWSLQTGTMYAYTFTDKDSSNNCLLSGGYSKVGSYADCSTTNMSYYVGGGADKPNLFVNNSGFTSASVCAELMSGNVVQYPLATESVTLLDPIPDNTIYTEGGGTIETIQDQTPVIDNCLDVGYLAV